MSRFDMLDALATRGFGITDPNTHYKPDSDAYMWRWICDELVQAMSDEQARDIMEFVARMYDVDLTDVDSD